MNWTSFKHHGDAPSTAFETLCNHLFERYIERTYGTGVRKFRVVNGKGGDGGVEAYAELNDGRVIAIQSKWFREDFKNTQIGEIRKSVKTAKVIRPNISEYIVCMPLDLTSLKNVKGSKAKKKSLNLTQNSGDQLITAFESEIKLEHPNMKLTWWLDNAIQRELMQPENEGIHKFWFGQEIMTTTFLRERFELAKHGWLGERYTPQLHAQGFIEKEIDASLFNLPFRRELVDSLSDYSLQITKALIAGRRVLELQNLPAKDARYLKAIIQKLGVDKLLALEISNKVESGDETLVTEWHGLKNYNSVLSRIKRMPQARGEGKMLVIFERALRKVNKHPGILALASFEVDKKQSFKIFLGTAGSGKTHALAHATDKHLQHGGPALIIDAQNTSVENWGTIISGALQLQGWSMEELFSALESYAVRNDLRMVQNGVKFGEELLCEKTKVLICVDGLDEATDWKSWKKRIGECSQHASKYTRLRVVFSARDYFYRSSELSSSKLPVFLLPTEGDVPYQRLVPEYFANYNISITSHTIIRGIDSLFALRLFCIEYQNHELTSSNQIITAGNKLLGRKINRMDEEFLDKLNKPIGSERRPVAESVECLADVFVSVARITHDELLGLLRPKLSVYLTGSELDILIDYLANNGILVKNVQEQNIDGVPKASVDYNISYRSIAEIIIANRIARRIVQGEIENITDKAFLNLFNAVPAEKVRLKQTKKDKDQSRQRIRQLIANVLFHEHGKLIGADGYLSKGLSDESITTLQFYALLKAPEKLAQKFRPVLDTMFFKNEEAKFFVLTKWILPASVEAENNFGARYLHDALSNQPSAFARDKVWQGFDRYDGGGNERYSLQRVLRSFSRNLELSPYGLYDERPLVYAWCLSTLDQHFRHDLRVSLTRWAVSQPPEFAKLVELMFPVADPQIQEDLASITLALAGRIRKPEHINILALMALKVVFSKPLLNRNVIVRAGFRAIVERAHQYGVVSEEQVKRARPTRQKKIQILPLDKAAVNQPREEIYPIKHDLAWNVIDKAFDNFLEYPHQKGDNLEDKDSNEARRLLDKYRVIYPQSGLYAYSWTMAAAIAYMRGLGFDRTEGNSYTDETGGSKSDLFTYEEKYTWLAVHYLKGYLADYVPHGEQEGNKKFIEDYFKIVHVPNPSESFMLPSSDDADFIQAIVIEENLVDKFVGEDAAGFVAKEVIEEPDLDFNKWLFFDESQFYISDHDEQLVALYNETTQYDSYHYVYARLTAIACLIPSKQKELLIGVLEADPEQFSFSAHLDHLITSPNTDTYTNPSDVVWMNWLTEYESSEEWNVDGDPLVLYKALAEVTSTSTGRENHIILPGKKVRDIARIASLDARFLKDKDQQIVGYLHQFGDVKHDRQEMVVLGKDNLQTALDVIGLELVWFVHIYKSKESNVVISKVPHNQRSRKYLVYFDKEKQLKNFKFWDEYASNTRDRYSQRTIMKLQPEVKTYNELTEDEVSQILTLIESGREVDAYTLPERLKEVALIAFFRIDNEIIATGAVKQPLKSYRTNVFKKALVVDEAINYSLELGYLFTKSRYRGKQLAKRLSIALLSNFEAQQIFATTRMGNMSVHSLFKQIGFEKIGTEYDNRARTDKLLLYVSKIDNAKLSIKSTLGTRPF